jgi:hypothetical protein
MPHRIAVLLWFACGLLGAAAGRAQDKKGIGDLDGLGDPADRGTHFRLVDVAHPGQGIGPRLYWRRCAGTVAAETAPVRFRMEGTDVIAPQLNKNRPADGSDLYVYPVEGSAEFSSGDFVLNPGGIPLTFEGVRPTSKHPAIRVVSGDVCILCAPLRLEVVDPRGVPVPSPIRLFDDKEPLLREEARFSVLTVWLPVAGQYHSSFGHIVLTAAGKIDAGLCQLADGVQTTATGLRKIVPAGAFPRPSTAPPATLTLRSAAGAIDLFVPAMVAPLDRVWLAVSRKRYQETTGQAPAASQITCTQDDGADGRPLVLEAGDGPAAANRAAAKEALNTPADDLTWFSAALPDRTAGPVTLRFKVARFGTAETTLLVAGVNCFYLIPHRWRTVFTDAETAVYELLVPQGTPAGEVQVFAQSVPAASNPPMLLGRLALPAVQGTGFDARLFTLNMADLPPGKYQLWVEAASRRSDRVPVTVVSWLPCSPFFAHSISGCTACWPTSDEGLSMLEKAGLEMVSATGANSRLDTAMPQIDPLLAARLNDIGNLPAELAMRPASNDRLLERLLERRLRLVDLTVCRALNFYNEGLSYHHSYPPSVQRMVRRMQLFTQQTGDYPSFWGVNYSWFPALSGYVEGGVPTDAHTADRNRVLAERVQAAGFPPLSRDQQQWLHKHLDPADPQERTETLRLTRQAVDHWRATHDLGWGEHNALYNAAVREVRPGTVCTLFENAGHNENKRIRAMFHAMDAQCYESYTDFGDWPMSAAFVVDWSRGQSPGQPVWLTTCWGTTSEGKMKSLFQAFARGLAGGGVPMEGTFDLAELARRGAGIRLLGQYGAIAAHATPDRRVAILSRTASLVLSRGMWDVHAAYYHLTRLGYPPTVVADEDIVALGIPEHVKVLVLVKEQLPWEPALRQTIEDFAKRGGKIVTVGGCVEPPAGAIAAAGQLKQLWELKGFQPDSHAEMWREFTETWRAALGTAMAQTGLPALATVDPEQGLALALDAGPIRYVVVIADAKGTHSNVFEPVAPLPLSLDGAGWVVRDLVAQKTLPATNHNGRTETTVDLLTEPAKLLVLYPAEPAELAIRATEGPRLGAPLDFQVDVAGSGASSLGPVPVRCTLVEPQGVARAELFRAAGDRIQIPLAIHDRPGIWRLCVQELLTGRTATAELNVAAPPAAAATAQQIGTVHIVNRDHLRVFAARPGEKLVIVEPEQPQLVSLAETLTDDLNKSGVKARLWRVRPEDYDTQPVRWYPTAADQQRLDEIEAGRLIGYRQNLRAYIDKAKRVHDPQRGGYAEIDPPYMVGRDCIVFSGGRLAESLRAASPWLETPHVPGKGQGRLVVCFSPFMANRQALAVVANDAEGFREATRELVGMAAAGAAKQATVAKAEGPLGPKLAVKTEIRPVAQPYANYTPLCRAVHLMCNRNGATAVLLRGDKDNLAMIDAQGKLTSVFTVDPTLQAYGRVDASGRLLWPTQKVLEKDPGWGFATQMAIAWQCIRPDAVLLSDLAAYAGPTATPDYQGGVVLADDGESGVLGRPGGLLYRCHGDSAWKRYDDLPAVRSRFAVLYPRQPVGVAFSPDGRFAVFTMDSRPPFGGMVGPTPRPTSYETLMLDLQTGRPIWSLHGTDDRRSTYAIHSGFAAVARDGAVTALADFDGGLHLVDKSGKVLSGPQIGDPDTDGRGRRGPKDGVAVRIADDGSCAALAFSHELIIARNQRFARVPVDGLVSVDVAADGQRVIAGLTDGRVVAYDTGGKSLWTATPGGGGPLVAVMNANEVLVATGSGDMVRLGAQGQELRRTQLTEPGSGVRKTLGEAPEVAHQTTGLEYLPPPTLAIAKEHMGARQVADWKPAATGREAFGRQFFPLAERAELRAEGADREFFAHLVYRRPDGNKSLRVETRGADGRETFWLDRVTPEYRVVDFPLRGATVQAQVISEGPAEIAEFSLWSFRWPGANIAFVKPAGIGSSDKLIARASAGIDLVEDLDDKTPQAGKMKACRIWFPNTDPDAVRGPWLPVAANPLEVVGGRRFGDGKLPPWSNTGQYAPSRGAFFTVDFGETAAPRLVAVYDRANRQSLLATNVAVFRADERDMLRGGDVLAGTIDSDQFWQLFAWRTAAKVRVLGVHIFKDAGTGVGLSQVEVYP